MALRTLARLADAALEATLVPSFSRVGYATRSRLERWEPPEQLDATGRRVLVTGVNSGLGFAVTRTLLRAGAEVVGTVRSEVKAADTRARLVGELGDDAAQRLSIEVADLADLASVRALAERCVRDHAPFDTLIHNAGAMFAEPETTVDGLERTYQVHVVAPFLLTARLLPHLRPQSRVITVTSGGMYTQALDVDRLTRPATTVDGSSSYRGSIAYAIAKRAQVALTAEWARRSGGDVTFHAVHPGWALTPGVEASLPTFRRLTGPILRNPQEGADTIAWLALAPDVPGNGGLWHDRRRRTAHKVPWTRTPRSETTRLWRTVAADAGVGPVELDARTQVSAGGRRATPVRPADQPR